MMKSLLFLLTLLVCLTGCASPDYAKYADMQIQIANARAEADKARFAALTQIAENGDATARVAAVMSMQQLGQSNTSPALTAPRSGADIALGFAGVLVPGLAQIYGIQQQTKLGTKQSDNNLAATLNQSNNATQLGLAQSDNSTKLGLSTNDTMLGFGKLINSPTVVTQPAPVVVTQPAPTIVTQPAPVIVTQPAPVIVTSPDPIVVTQPEPVVIVTPPTYVSPPNSN